MQGSTEEGARQPTFRDKMNSVVAISQCIAKPVEALWRRFGTPGLMYLGGMHCVIGCLFLIVFVTLVDGPHVPYPYGTIATGVVVVALATHRLDRRKNEAVGRFTHSLSPGESWIPGPPGFVHGVLEPAITIAVGLVVKGFSLGLGHYLVVAGLALAINGQWQNLARLARIRAMRDAYLEQMAQHERYRNGGY